MIKYFYQKFGSNVAVGMAGDEEEIQSNFLSFHNRSIPNGELFWETPNFAWFWSKPSRFAEGLVQIREAVILNKLDDAYNRMKDSTKEITELTPKLKALAVKQAGEWFATFGKTQFIKKPIKGEMGEGHSYRFSEYKIEEENEE